jgi:transcription elongation factor Elf1
MRRASELVEVLHLAEPNQDDQLICPVCGDPLYLLIDNFLSCGSCGDIEISIDEVFMTISKYNQVEGHPKAS